MWYPPQYFYKINCNFFFLHTTHFSCLNNNKNILIKFDQVQNNVTSIPQQNYTAFSGFMGCYNTSGVSWAMRGNAMNSVKKCAVMCSSNGYTYVFMARTYIRKRHLASFFLIGPIFRSFLSFQKTQR